METHGKPQIAVIGAGVAGITAAYLLDQKYQVTLFEKNNYIGGHTNTRLVTSGPDAGLAIDTGFIVCNAANYPLFYKFLAALDVELQDCQMSFGFYCQNTGLKYIGPRIDQFLRLPESLLNPTILKLIWEQRRFNRAIIKDLDNSNNFAGLTLREYLNQKKVSQNFWNNYITPLLSSIWSSPEFSIDEFPALTFAAFFNNHGMFDFAKVPRWQTVKGGSHFYVRAFSKQFTGKIVSNSKIKSIQRETDGISIIDADNTKHKFDYLVSATHADEALQLIQNPTADEKKLLGAWRYNQNHTILHTDKSVLPYTRRAWAAWNYCRTKSENKDQPVSITYYMNQLQNLKCKNHYFVTLNQKDRIDPDKVIYQTTYTHPIYNEAAVSTQAKLRQINGADRIFYCGSYFGYGFHEDAVRSANEVATKLGVSL